MIDPEVQAAYLFLKALESTGYIVQTFDIHLAWLSYCRNINKSQAAYDLVGAAKQKGFGQDPNGVYENVSVGYES